MARGKSADPNVPWRNWYGLARWQKRKRHQLRLAPALGKLQYWWYLWERVRAAKIVLADIVLCFETHRSFED